MASITGTIKRLTDRGFGFIAAPRELGIRDAQGAAGPAGPPTLTPNRLRRPSDTGLSDMTRTHDCMRRAVHIAGAHMRAGAGGPFGAVIARAGAIIAEGHNQVTSTNDPTAHAEITAIRHAGRVLGTFDLSGYELYASCEPCPMCLAAIYWARLDRVYFANTRADAARIGFDDAWIYAEIPKAPGDVNTSCSWWQSRLSCSRLAGSREADTPFPLRAGRSVTVTSRCSGIAT